jgi:hypothetical protein
MKIISLRRAFMASLTAALLAAASAQAAGPFFRAEKTDGRWWLTDPDGRRFLSKGVTTVQYAQDMIRDSKRSPYGETAMAKYGSPDAWRTAVAKRLLGWGFNTLGAWSDEELARIDVEGRHLAYAPTVDLGALGAVRLGHEKQPWLHGVFPDVFDPRFATVAAEIARQRCTPRQNDPRLLGWFSDNELRWGPDWRGSDELLTLFLALSAKAPGRAAAVALLRQRHGTIARFNDVWQTRFSSWDALLTGGTVKPPVVRPAVYAQNEAAERTANAADPRRAAFVADCDAFVAQLAQRYFRVTSEAIRAADPHHLLLGCRFAYLPPAAVLAAAAEHLDVISLNCYERDPRQVLDGYGRYDKPLLIGEFSFRSRDSGLPNTHGAGPIVATQAERAAAYTAYVTAALSRPNLVGYHWFEHADQPREGRFDGENSNYGLVNIRDEPYQLLIRAMSRINREAERRHDDLKASAVGLADQSRMPARPAAAPACPAPARR